MTHTAEDLAFALAALDEGVTPYQSWHELWNTEHDDEVLTFGHPSPLIALSAAGRALKLQPKWVVVDLATANVAHSVINREIDGLSIRICNAIDEGIIEDEAALRGTRDALKRASKALANALSSTPLKDGDKT